MLCSSENQRIWESQLMDDLQYAVETNVCSVSLVMKFGYVFLFWRSDE